VITSYKTIEVGLTENNQIN